MTLFEVSCKILSSLFVSQLYIFVWFRNLKFLLLLINLKQFIKSDVFNSCTFGHTVVCVVYFERLNSVLVNFIFVTFFSSIFTIFPSSKINRCSLFLFKILPFFAEIICELFSEYLSFKKIFSNSPLEFFFSINIVKLLTASINFFDLISEGKISADKVESINQRTRDGGAEIVKYLEKGSAYYAPAASGVEMAISFLNDEKKVLPCAAYLNGEYGIKNVYAGVPVLIGNKGVEKMWNNEY